MTRVGVVGAGWSASPWRGSWPAAAARSSSSRRRPTWRAPDRPQQRRGPLRPLLPAGLAQGGAVPPGVGLLRDFCAEHGARLRRVRQGGRRPRPGRAGAAQRIEERARANGVPGLRRLDAAALRELEPHVPASPRCTPPPPRSWTTGRWPGRWPRTCGPPAGRCGSAPGDAVTAAGGGGDRARRRRRAPAGRAGGVRRPAVRPGRPAGRRRRRPGDRPVPRGVLPAPPRAAGAGPRPGLPGARPGVPVPRRPPHPRVDGRSTSGPNAVLALRPGGLPAGATSRPATCCAPRPAPGVLAAVPAALAGRRRRAARLAVPARVRRPGPGATCPS